MIVEKTKIYKEIRYSYNIVSACFMNDFPIKKKTQFSARVCELQESKQHDQYSL